MMPAAARTIFVDFLHPGLALRLLVAGGRDGNVRYAYRARGFLTTWLLALLDRRLGSCTRSEPAVAAPDGSNRSLYWPIQNALVSAGLQARAYIEQQVTLSPMDKPACWRRFAGILVNRAFTELWTYVQFYLVAQRDAGPDDLIYLHATRFDRLCGNLPWSDATRPRVTRHRALLHRRVVVRPELYVDGRTLELSMRTRLTTLLRAIVGIAIGLFQDFRAGSDSLPRERWPFVFFSQPDQLERVPVGFDWMQKASVAPLGLLPFAELKSFEQAARDKGCAAVAPYDFSPRGLRMDPRYWQGYGGWLRRLVVRRPRCRLRGSDRLWFWALWLGHIHRESYFCALFERMGTRLTWSQSQIFSIEATAMASALIRLGGAPWGTCSSTHDTLDTFSFRSNCSTVFCWGTREKPIIEAAGTEHVDVAGYPENLKHSWTAGRELREQIQKQGFSKIVALYDNKYMADMMVNEHDLRRLYASAFEILERQRDVYLVVKTKDAATLRTAVGEDAFGRLERDPRIRLDTIRNNYAPALAADVVVVIMLGLPGLIAACAGIPTFSLDPAGYADLAYAPNVPTFSYCPDGPTLVARVMDVLNDPQSLDSAARYNYDSILKNGLESRFDAFVNDRVRKFLSIPTSERTNSASDMPDRESQPENLAGHPNSRDSNVAVNRD